MQRAEQCHEIAKDLGRVWLVWGQADVPKEKHMSGIKRKKKKNHNWKHRS